MALHLIRATSRPLLVRADVSLSASINGDLGYGSKEKKRLYTVGNVVLFVNGNNCYRFYQVEPRNKRLDESSFNWDTVFISLYILWMVIELRVTKKDISTEDKKTSDFATCQLYGTGQALTFLTALWRPSVLWISILLQGLGPLLQG